MSKVFLDMDGVLIDFDRGLEQFNAKSTAHFYTKPKSEWTDLQIRMNQQVEDCMNTPGFFLNLPVMEGAKELWATAGNPSVLTAWPSTTKDRARIGYEKYQSIKANFEFIHPSRFIFCGREDKSRYAYGNSRSPTMTDKPNILVDDLTSNCEAWEKAGGIAILFKNSQQAIKELKLLANRQ